MKIKITNVHLSPKDKISHLALIARELKINKEKIKSLNLVSQSIDARKKDNIFYVLSFIAEGDFDNKVLKNKHVAKYENKPIRMKYTSFEGKYRPVIVGFGPAGIFAALYLTRCGAKPVILERGASMDERVSAVEEFLKHKRLNPDSNIQFGEGGAGTFSDGKLQTNANDPLISYILNEFVRYGAPKDIIYEAMPHIGTDNLRFVIKNMRQDMEQRGASFYFNTKLKDIGFEEDGVLAITDTMSIKTSHLILGLGHSARDTFKMLDAHNIKMEPKSFSMGVRIEHKREFINRMQYGDFAPYLPAASYKSAVHLENGRSLYSFCMCPGGEVMASASEEGTIVTNGMSYYSRDKDNSNAALLVNVEPKDFYKSSVLDGLDYQEYYERQAFNLAGDYRAPANLMKEFLEGKVASALRSVVPSYPHGVKLCSFKGILPDYIIDTIRDGLVLMDKKLHGFYHPDAVLTGIESRSSCPLRILRDDMGVTSNFLYPIGEGAGYAGGITTAALDGLKCAMKIVGDYQKNKY